MTQNQRVESFIKLGNLLLSNYGTQLIHDWAMAAKMQNTWFTEENIKIAITNIAKGLLAEKNLSQISAKYPEITKKLNVGLLLAGNIPAVGFHDIMCVLLAGHTAYIKLSSQDEVLIKNLLDQLLILEPDFMDSIVYATNLKNIDALIATGSDNTARHFEFYFKNIPKIIRKNRTSVAVLSGSESADTFQLLADDIIMYFGLGCRNVSKLLITKDIDLNVFYPAIQHKVSVLDNIKYQNNYDYNRSILLVNKEPHFDNGFLTLRPSSELVSPISVLYYQKFETLEDISNYIDTNKDKIQCVLSENGWFTGSLPIGEAQCPSFFDYADGVDTLQFLSSL